MYLFKQTNIYDIMDTKQLVRVNPKISGNVKLVIGNDDLHLESFDVPNFTDPRFKNYKLDPKSSYPVDVKNFLRKNVTLPDAVLYQEYLESSATEVYPDFKNQYESFYKCGCKINSDAYYKERYRMLTSLWLGDVIPDFYMVFRIEDDSLNFEVRTFINPAELIPGNKYRVQNGEIGYYGRQYVQGEEFVAIEDISYIVINGGELIDITSPDINNNFLKNFISPSEIVKVFDLREGTKLGEYVRHLTKDVNFKEDDIFVDNKARTVDFYGIDTISGVITTKRESMDYYVSNDTTIKEFDKFLTEGFKRNGLLNMRNLNIEFMFDDDQNTGSFAKYYGLYLNLKQLATFYPEIERKDSLEIRRTSLFGNDVTIDLNKQLRGVVPIIIKNFRELGETETQTITTTVKKLYYHRFGSFSGSFSPSFDVADSARIGTLQDGNTYLVETDMMVATNSTLLFRDFMYLKFRTPQTLTTGGRLTVSNYSQFDYCYDITGLAFTNAIPVPWMASHLCSMLVDTLAALNTDLSTTFTMDDMTMWGLALLDTKDKVMDFPAVFRNDEITSINIEIPTFTYSKDYMTTASYYFLSTQDKIAKINNIASDENIVEQDNVVLYNVEGNRNYTYLDYFFNVTSTQFTDITIGTEIGTITLNLYGPINMRRLIDELNRRSSLLAPILTIINEVIVVEIAGYTFTFRVVTNANFQRKLVLNRNDWTNMDANNFRTLQVTGTRLKEAGRAMLELDFQNDFTNGDYFQFKLAGRFLFDVMADDSCINTPTGHAYRYFSPILRPTFDCIAEAFNHEFRRKYVPARAFALDGKLFIIADNQGEHYNQFSVELFSRTNGFNDTHLAGGTDYSVNRILVDEYPALNNVPYSYVALESKYVKIVSITRYIDDVDSSQDILSPKYVITFLSKSTHAFSYEGAYNLLEFSPVIFSIGEIIGIADFDTDTFSSIYNKSHSLEYYKYYNVKILIDGHGYVVKKASYDTSSTSIMHNGTVYVEDDEFIAHDADFVVLSGNPVIIDKKFYDDHELIAFAGFNSVSQRIVNQQSANAGLLSDKLSFFSDTDANGTEYDRNRENEMIEFFLDNMASNNCKFIMTGSSDVRSNPYRIALSTAFGDMNYTPSFHDLEAQAKYFTHEWYYLSAHPDNINLFDFSLENSYFSVPFDKNLLKSAATDYFTDYFNYKYPVLNNDFTNIAMVQAQKRYSIIKKVRKEGSKFINTTLFRGVRMKFVSDMDMTGWKFSAILVIKKTDLFADAEPVSYESIVNETYKNYTVIVTVNLDDYKVVRQGRSYGEYSYLYMMNSIRTFNEIDRSLDSGFHDGIFCPLPTITPTLVDDNDNTISGIYVTKLYVKPKSFNATEIVFDAANELDQQYRVLRTGGHSRIWMMDQNRACLSTMQNGYLTSAKYRVDMPTTVLKVQDNVLTLDTSGIFLINLPALNSGINVSPAVLGSIYNISRLTWLEQDGGAGYMTDIRKKISFGYLAKINKEQDTFSTAGIKLEFLEPDKITKSNQFEVSMVERQVEGNAALTTKVPVATLRPIEKQIYRYSGGGTILLKDALDFLDFNCYMNIANAPGDVTATKRMDTFGLPTELMDAYNHKYMSYTLHDITPLGIDGSAIYNGFTLRGNYVFGVLANNFGILRNKWYHKVSKSNVITTTNPVYYNINETAIEKGMENIFLTNFDLKYQIFNRNSVDKLDWFSSARLSRNYFNTVMFGIDEQTDFSEWDFKKVMLEAEFDAALPAGNECYIYQSPTQVKVKINIEEIIVFYYKNKLVPIFLEKFGNFPGFDEYMTQFIKYNISGYVNVKSKDLLTRKTRSGLMTLSLAYNLAIGQDYQLSKTSVVSNSGIVTFTLISDGNVMIVPYVSFGK